MARSEAVFGRFGVAILLAALVCVPPVRACSVSESVSVFVVNEAVSSGLSSASTARVGQSLAPGHRLPRQDSRALVDMSDPLINGILWVLTLLGCGAFYWSRGARKLNRERARIEGVLALASDLIVVLAPDATIYSMSPSALRILGIEPGQTIGKRFTNWIDPADRKRFLTMINTPTERAKGLVFRAKGTETVTLEGNVAFADLSNSRITLVCRDVSGCESTDSAFRKLNSDLEQRVRERTRALDEAKADLEAFCASVSHDLRAPLRAVRGFASILMEDRAELSEADRTRYLTNIEHAGEEMDRLISDLLAYARLGHNDIRKAPVHLSDVLDTVRNTLDSEIVSSGAEIICPSELPVIMGSRTLFEQIFRNLLSNALAYHRPGMPPRIHIYCDERPDDILIGVSDNGIGIADGQKDRIFGMFKRLHTEEQYPGTGIGLAIVKKSVEMMGGEIWVESGLDEGSTFCFRLPRTRVEENEKRID